MFLTNGASFGLHMALSLFTSPGSGYTRRAFIISPTYFLASRAFEDAGFADKMVAIRSDETSIDFGALLEGLQRAERESPDVSLENGLRPVLRAGSPHDSKRIYRYVMYCVPSYSNPTGTSWDLETRRRVVKIAREWDMLVVSDDVYDFLGNDDQGGAVLPRLVSIDAVDACGAGNTLSNSSFSKLVGPGLRVGWLESATGVLATQLGLGGANHSVCYSFLPVGECSADLDVKGGCPSHFSTCIIYALLLPISPMNPVRKVDTIVASLTKAYTHRCRCLFAAIREYLPEGTEVWGGRGGFFAWVGLPRGVDAKEVVRIAATKEGVVLASGSMSECPGEGNSMGWGDRWIRVSVSYCEGEEVVEGIRRLGRAVERWNAGERVEGSGDAVLVK